MSTSPLNPIKIDHFTIQTGLAALGLYKYDKKNNIIHLKKDTLINPKNRIIRRVNDWLKKHQKDFTTIISPKNFSKDINKNRQEYLDALLNGVYKKTIQFPDLTLTFETGDIFLDYLDFVFLVGMELWYNFYIERIILGDIIR